MKNLFKLVSESENFAGFVWQEQPEAEDYDLDYKVDAKSKSILEADLNKEDIAKIEEARRGNIASKLSTIKNISEEEKKSFIKFIQEEISNTKYGEAIDSKEWTEIMKNSDKVLNEILATRKYLDKKNKIINSVVDKIDDQNKKEQILGKLNNLFSNIEKNISKNKEKIDWKDWDKVEFVKKTRYEKEIDSRGNVINIPVPDGFEIRIDNKGWNGETVLLEQKGEVSEKDMEFYQNIATNLSSVFGDLRNVNFSSVEEITKNENPAKKEKTNESSESPLDKLKKEDVDSFVNKFTNGQINWRQGNEELAELLGVENTEDQIKKIQNELGIYGVAADGKAGTQTFARLYNRQGWERPKTFDNPITEQYLASWEKKIDVSGEDVDKRDEILNKIKKNLDTKFGIKNSSLGDPKKVNGIVKVPLEIKDGDNKGTYVAIQSGNSYEFKESWGTGSYVDKIFSNKSLKKVEAKAA